MVTACESFPSNSLSSSPNIIFSVICIWRSCQAKKKWSLFGSWVPGYCHAFPMVSAFSPLNWLSPHWFRHSASVTNPMAFNALAYDLKHEVFTISLYNTQGISGTSRCLCKCDLLQDEYNAYQFPYNKIICCTIGRQLLLHYHSMIRK